MPGQPLRRAIAAELEKRAREEIGPDASVVDYACHWVSSGGTLAGLARVVEPILGLKVSRETLRSVVYKGDENGETERRLRIARAQGAHAMVEEARDIVDDAPIHRDALVKAKMQADIRQSIAGKWNRDELGDRPAAGVVVNIGSLHLDSLRRVNLTDGSNNPLRVIAEAAEVVEAPRLTAGEPGEPGEGSTGR